MDVNYLTNPLVFLIEVTLGFYTLLVMLRFLLQLVDADFYNPISQFVIKLTTPVLRPFRRIIPMVAGLDVPALFLAWLVAALQTWLIISLSDLSSVRSSSVLLPLMLAIPELIELAIHIFLFAVLIQTVLSWFGNTYRHPAYSILESLTKPLFTPVRRIVPMISGIDLSPMLIMLGLMMLNMLLVPPIRGLVVAFF